MATDLADKSWSGHLFDLSLCQLLYECITFCRRKRIPFVTPLATLCRLERFIALS